MSSAPPSLASTQMFSMRSLFSKQSSSSSSSSIATSSLVNTVALEDAVKRGDLHQLSKVFNNDLRPKLQSQQQQPKRNQEPSGAQVLVNFLDSLVILSVSLGRTSRVTQWLVRQPEISLETRLWAACHSQIPYVIDDLVREWTRHGQQHRGPRDGRNEEEASAEEEEAQWMRLWVACATGRAQMLKDSLEFFIALGESKLAQTLNQGHVCDGTTPLGIALHFGHHRAIVIPHLLPFFSPESSLTGLIDFGKTDFKGRNLLHLALLSPSVTSADQQKEAWEDLPQIVCKLLTLASKKGVSTMDLNGEILVKGAKKTAVQILLDHLRSLESMVTESIQLRWQEVVRGEAAVEEATVTCQASWSLAECLRLLLESECSLPTTSVLLDDICENGAWGNVGLLEWQIRSAERSPSLKALGSCYLKACEQGAQEVAILALDTMLTLPWGTELSSKPSKDEFFITEHFLKGFKMAAALGYGPLLIVILDYLEHALKKPSHTKPSSRSNRGRSTSTSKHKQPETAIELEVKRSLQLRRIALIDWSSPVPDGTPVIHLLINFGLASVVSRLLSLGLEDGEQLIKLDFNKQSDLRTKAQRERDEESPRKSLIMSKAQEAGRKFAKDESLPSNPKIHRTACLTPCLGVVRLKWLEVTMNYYGPIFPSTSGPVVQPTPNVIPSSIHKWRNEVLVAMIQDDGGKHIQLKQQGLGNEAYIVHEAARCGNFEAVSILLNQLPSVDLNQVDYLGRSLLYFAVLYENVDAVRYLLQFRQLNNVNERASDGSFPLQLAVENNNLPVTQLLLQFGQSIDPNMVISQATSSSRTRTVDPFSLRNLDEERKRAGGSTANLKSANTTTTKGETVLHVACALGFSEIVRELVAHSSTDVNAVSTKGTTPLCNACISGSLDAVKQLVKCQDINLTLGENEANTPIHLAAKNGHSQIVEVLLDTMDPSLVGEDILETLIRFCPEVLKARFESAVWKENLSRASLEFCYVCDWKASFMIEGVEGKSEQLSQSAKKRDLPPAPRVSFLLNSMVGYHSDELLQTTLVRTVIDLKWRRYRFFGYLSLFLYLVYLGCFTFLALVAFGIVGTEALSFPLLSVLEVLLIVLSSMWLIAEVFSSMLIGTEMIANDWLLPRVHEKVIFYISLGLRQVIFYLRKPQNWVKLFALIPSLLFGLACFLLLLSSGDAYHPTPSAPSPSSMAFGEELVGLFIRNPAFVRIVVPLSLLAAWLNTLSMLRTTPVFGLRVDLHVQMYFQVVKTLLSSLLLFGVLLSGFTFALVLFTTTGTSLGRTASPAAIVNSLVMLVLSSFGDLQFIEQFDSAYTSSSAPAGSSTALLGLSNQIGMTVSVLFLVMVPLMAFNFLVALAVGDVNILLCQARIESLRTRAMMISSLDNLFGSCGGIFKGLRKELPADGRIFPNETGFFTLLLSFLGIIDDSAPFSYELSSAPSSLQLPPSPSSLLSSEVRKVHPRILGASKQAALSATEADQAQVIRELREMVDALRELKSNK